MSNKVLFPSSWAMKNKTQSLANGELLPTKVLNSMATVWANWINKQLIHQDPGCLSKVLEAFVSLVLCTAYFLLRTKMFSLSWKILVFSRCWQRRMETLQMYFTVCKSFMCGQNLKLRWFVPGHRGKHLITLVLTGKGWDLGPSGHRTDPVPRTVFHGRGWQRYSQYPTPGELVILVTHAILSDTVISIR